MFRMQWGWGRHARKAAVGGRGGPFSSRLCYPPQDIFKSTVGVMIYKIIKKRLEGLEK